VKNIIFNNLKIKNFLSIGNEELYLNFKTGINLITGENQDKGGRNGVGKSSLIEAMYWCLFGNTIRDIKKDKVIHNQTKKGCQVVLDFQVKEGNDKTNYRLTRSLEPTKVLLEKITDNSSEDVSLSTIPKNDEYIKKLIGANEEVFQNAVIMTANNTLPFMAQKKIDKRKFIEGILNLGIFGEMLLKVRSDYNEKKKENDLLGKDFINEQRILEILKENKEGFSDSKQARIKIIDDKIKLAAKDLDTLKNKNIQDVSIIKNDIKKYEEKIEKLQDLLKESNKEAILIGEKRSEMFNTINQAKKEKQKILDKGNTCPTCNREYCEDDLSHIEAEIKRLDNIININTVVYDNCVKKANDINEYGEKIKEKINNNRQEIKELTEKVSEASLHDQKIKTLLEKIEEYQENVKSIENEIFKDDKKIQNSEEKLKSIESEIESLQKTLLILENSKFIVSEEGVKTFIVKKMLSVLNSQLNFYLKTLDAPCTCIFDELFEETITNNQGKECSYFNFSGGERKRIDIAVLFMFQDILRKQTGVSFNLSMYDELLDSAVDEKGINKIMDILNERKETNNESIYIVSHNKNATNFNFDNIIQLKKVDGKTSIVS
jgi:DNA repair exonuclease SbcCD ATPase subunit